MASEKLNTPLCYLVLSGSIVYSVLLYFFLRYRVLLGYLLYVYPYSLFYRKARHHALFSEFVNVNKFEETCMITSILLASTKRPILVRCGR